MLWWSHHDVHAQTYPERNAPILLSDKSEKIHNRIEFQQLDILWNRFQHLQPVWCFLEPKKKISSRFLSKCICPVIFVVWGRMKCINDHLRQISDITQFHLWYVIFKNSVRLWVRIMYKINDFKVNWKYFLETFLQFISIRIN